MARCRCDPDTCACQIIAGTGINIGGTGDLNSPWIISALPSCVDCITPANPGDVPTWDAATGKYVPMQPAETPESCVDCATAPNPGDALLWDTTLALYSPGLVPPGAQGEPGAQGPQGPQGVPGESVQVMGSVPVEGDLVGVVSPEVGEGWISEDTGDLWVYTGPDPNDSIEKWTNVGDITGPAGVEGPRGSLWYTGSGAPVTFPGELPNDMYLDVVTGDVYQFAA